MTTMPWRTNSITDLPLLLARSNGNHVANCLMAGNTGAV